MYRPLKLRIRLARRFANQLYIFNDETDRAPLEVSATTLLDSLKRATVVEQDERIVVTEVGFVTMALIPQAASYQQKLLVIPGVDDHAQKGYLVLREGYAPYHSLAPDAEQAAIETWFAHARAEELVTFFGDRRALKLAATSAPWYLFSRVEDVVSAGLCEWGSISFLRRHGLYRIAFSMGLPRFALRLAGSYGNRITASTLRRHQREMAVCANVAPEH